MILENKNEKGILTWWYGWQQSVCDHAALWSNKIMNEKGVEFRQIDTDIGKQKRAARRIPRPLADMLG